MHICHTPEQPTHCFRLHACRMAHERHLIDMHGGFSHDSNSAEPHTYTCHGLRTHVSPQHPSSIGHHTYTCHGLRTHMSPQHPSSIGCQVPGISLRAGVQARYQPSGYRPGIMLSGELPSPGVRCPVSVVGLTVPGISLRGTGPESYG